jgi:hypothetical protein
MTAPEITGSVLVHDLSAQEWVLHHHGVQGVELESGDPLRIRLRAPDLNSLYYALREMADLVGAHLRHPAGKGLL